MNRRLSDLDNTAAPKLMIGSNGSRAARLSQPRTVEVLQQLAVDHDVCVRPVPMRRILPDGRSEVIDVRCGATRASKCPSCAARAKRLRKVQCREGWHRTDEPITPKPATDQQTELVNRRAELEFAKARAEQLGQWSEADDLGAAIIDVERQIPRSGLRGATVRTVIRRVRSTKRRQDTPNLPRRKVDSRTIGQVYIGRDGRQHRQSLFLTLTLGSYGPVRRDDSTPLDMDRYDYKRAALDAVHFPALLDRFWQNLRRAVGWNVQYYGCVEPQKRLAPHAHYAVRGTFPRAIFKQVAAATYHQVWQPPTDTVVFGEDGPQPEWLDTGDPKTSGYMSPFTGELLPTWEQAMDELDATIEAGEAMPAHVVRFGDQVHVGGHQHGQQHDEDGQWIGERRMGIEGIEAGTDKAEKAIAYLVKYLTKSVDECHQRTTPREIEHHRRFHEALRFTPCSPRCANWLRYGIQPRNARAGMVAGRCRGKVHQPATLGIGGRRVLVSRDWSGKTLADHKADQNAWVRRVLALGLGHPLDQPQQPETVDDGQTGEHPQDQDQDQGQDQGQEHDQAAGQTAPAPMVRWQRADPRDRDVKPLHQRLWRSLGERIRRRAEWQTALMQLSAQTGPPEPTGHVSATHRHEEQPCLV